MRSRRGRSQQSPIFDVNVTPIIDVSLVLVVILLVATPLAFQSSIAVQRGAEAGRAAEIARAERIEVTIVSADSLTVNRVPVPRVIYALHLRALLDRSASKQVFVRCPDHVSNGAFVGILDETKLCGAANIAVMGG